MHSIIIHIYIINFDNGFTYFVFRNQNSFLHWYQINFLLHEFVWWDLLISIPFIISISIPSLIFMTLPLLSPSNNKLYTLLPSLVSYLPPHSIRSLLSFTPTQSYTTALPTPFILIPKNLPHPPCHLFLITHICLLLNPNSHPSHIISHSPYSLAPRYTLSLQILVGSISFPYIAYSLTHIQATRSPQRSFLTTLRTTFCLHC